MLLIRKAQIRALQDLMLKRFEADMVKHLNEHFPEECANLDQEAIREEIQYGIKRAKTYAIEMENDVSRYINLMFIFGTDFDTDSNLAWASKILRNNELRGPHKMDLLYEEAESHMADSNNIA